MSKYKYNDYQKVWEDKFGDKKTAKDNFGEEIKFEKYGDENSDFGWEIDHIYPKARGGGESLVNKQPLHFKSNKAKSDDLSGTINHKEFQIRVKEITNKCKKIGEMIVE